MDILRFCQFPQISSQSRPLLVLRTWPSHITITTRWCALFTLAPCLQSFHSTRQYNFVLINKLYALPDPPKLSRSVLKFCLSWLQRRLSHFIFYGQYYDQIDGVAVGSPLGSVMANILMCHFEEKWVLNSNARPSIWFRYVDDTFTLFDSKDIAVLRSPFCLVMKGHSSTAMSLLSNDVNVSSTYRNQTEGWALLLRKKKKTFYTISIPVM